MKIIVHRQHFGETFTISKMFFDGEDIGIFVLEDKYREIEGQPVKDWKVQNETAIPKGIYKLIFDFSNRFQRVMPHILDVEGFEGVRIHSGNSSKNTEGCLILGLNWDGNSDWVSDSKKAVELFNSKVKDVDNITIELK
jgi:hypothetical protein